MPRATFMRRELQSDAPWQTFIDPSHTGRALHQVGEPSPGIANDYEEAARAAAAALAAGGTTLPFTYGAGIAPCSGMSCGFPAFMVIACGLTVVMIAAVLGYTTYTRAKYRAALRQGMVPARRMMSHVGSTQTKQDMEAFAFYVTPATTREQVKEDACPVCLRELPKAGSWVVFKCSHATCHRCFKQLVKRQRLHAQCPLCRHMLAEGEGDRGPRESEHSGGQRAASAAGRDAAALSP